MNNRFIEALDICLSAMQTGVSIEKCISLYPDFADDLRPFLETAEEAQSIDVNVLPDGIMERSRSKLLNHAAKLRSKRNPFILFLRMPKLVYAAMLVTLFFFVSSSGLVVASAKSLPGDRLYPVKRAVENIQVDLVLSEKNKRHIEADQTQKRLTEVAELMGLRRESQVSFEGIVNEINDGLWLVGEIPVRLSSNTIKIGDIQVGNLIEVEGKTTAEGYVLAEEVHRRNYIFFGQVEQIDPDTWMISGNEFRISSGTQIDQSIRPGNQVLVMVRSDDDAQYALAIFRLSDGTDLNQSGGVTREEEIDSYELEIIGVVESIQPGLWTVSGQMVYVNPSTRIKNQVQMGDTVKIHIKTGEGEIYIATEIETVEVNKSGDEQISEEDGSGDEDSGKSEQGENSDSGNNDQTGEANESESGSDSSSDNPTQVAPQPVSSDENSGENEDNPDSDDDAGDEKSGSDESNQGSPDDPNEDDDHSTPTPEDSDDDDDHSTQTPEDSHDDDNNPTPTPDETEEEEEHP